MASHRQGECPERGSEATESKGLRGLTHSTSFPSQDPPTMASSSGVVRPRRCVYSGDTRDWSPPLSVISTPRASYSRLTPLRGRKSPLGPFPSVHSSAPCSRVHDSYFRAAQQKPRWHESGSYLRHTRRVGCRTRSGARKRFQSRGKRTRGGEFPGRTRLQTV